MSKEKKQAKRLRRAQTAIMVEAFGDLERELHWANGNRDHIDTVTRIFVEASQKLAAASADIGSADGEVRA